MKANRLILFVLFVLFVSHVEAEEDRSVEPFIKDKFYKQNITLEEFRLDPRKFFRSETAFDLLTDYVGGEVGLPSLTNAEFIALMKDENQVKARNCSTTESINTGGIQGNQFYWFKRNCRLGEQIVQVKSGDRWVDVFSLSCLNAKEDTTPVTVPMLSPLLVAEKSEGPSGCRFVSAGETWNPGISTFISESVVEGCGSIIYAPSLVTGFSGSVSKKSRLVCE